MKNSFMDWEHWFDEGLTFFQEEKYQEAIEAFTRVISINPSIARAFNNRALAYNQTEQFSLAFQDFHQAIALEPQDSNTFFNRGISYYKSKQYQLAIEDFDSVLAIHADIECCLLKGVAQVKLAFYSEAIECFNQALLIDENEPRAYLNRGATYGHLGEIELAQQDFERAKQLKPDYEQANYNLNLYSKVVEK